MSKSVLSKGQTIDNKYSVSFFLKKGSYAETYRAQNEAKATKFLKLFDFAKLIVKSVNPVKSIKYQIYSQST